LLSKVIKGCFEFYLIKGLKIPRLKGRAGSIPAPGTIYSV